MNGAVPLLGEDEMQKTLIELKRKVVALQAQERAAAQQRNLQAGEEFLAANAKRDGVISLPSGLQYRVLARCRRPGSIPRPR